MPEPKKVPRIVDCPTPSCKGKVDLAADENTCSECGIDVGEIERRYKHQRALAEWERREVEKNKPAKPEHKGFSW